MIWNFELGFGLVNNIYNSRNYVNYDKLLDYKVKATCGNEDRAVRLILNFSELKKVAGDLSVSFNLPSSVKLSLNFYLDMVSPFSPRCSVQEIINVLHIANRALLKKKHY